MELELYLNHKLSNDDLIAIIKNALKNINADINIFKSEGINIYFGCHNFALHIDTEDMYCQNSVSDEYNMEVSLYISIEVYSKTYKDGIKKVFEFISEMVKNVDKDTILLKSTSSDPIFKKHSGKIEYGEDSELLNEIAMLKKSIES